MTAVQDVFQRRSYNDEPGGRSHRGFWLGMKHLDVKAIVVGGTGAFAELPQLKADRTQQSFTCKCFKTLGIAILGHCRDLCVSLWKPDLVSPDLLVAASMSVSMPLRIVPRYESIERVPGHVEPCILAVAWSRAVIGLECAVQT